MRPLLLTTASWSCPLQRKKDGESARGPTEEEFVDDVLPTIIRALKAEEGRGDVAPVLAQAGGWHFSWDGDGIHRSGDIKGKLGIEGEELPPYSPDMHCVVEHAIGRLWQRFTRRKAEVGPRAKVEEYMSLIEECFKDTSTNQTIWCDVARLPLIYDVISAPPEQLVHGKYRGSDGDWPHPRPYH